MPGIDAAPEYQIAVWAFLVGHLKSRTPSPSGDQPRSRAAGEAEEETDRASTNQTRDELMSWSHDCQSYFLDAELCKTLALSCESLLVLLDMPQTYEKPAALDPLRMPVFLKGRTLFEMADARVLKVEPNRGTGRIEITFESPTMRGMMLFPHRLVKTVTFSLRQAIAAYVPDEARDHLLSPVEPADPVVHEFGLGDASIVAADAEWIHVMIHARSKPETMHLMLNAVEAARFALEADAGYNALTPKERAQSDVVVLDPGFELWTRF